MTIFRFRQKASQLIRSWQQFKSKSFLSLQSLVLIKGILLSLLSLVVFLSLTDEVIELETRDWDLNIMLAIQKTHTPVLDVVMKSVSALAGLIVLTGICIGLGFKFWIRRQRTELLGLSIAAGGGTLLNFGMKAFFNRDRPQMWALVNDHLNTSSYPSGHVTIGLVIYGFCGYLLARYFPGWRLWIYLGTVLLMLAIGWSRMYVGLHWPTDVLAGYATGFGWLNASILSFEIRKQREEMRRQ
ncbi:phosphatase PAP2 family protein [Oscillatoria sp. HE19RPO]|uniref:phosphatase PAP2 family protein n=1 Tax=Oscillatoria sp. HE19RPO TaxID=2954806 RepID=UPI0020C57056|nr:phosphatase PAP2 family protein [Oscillatoria sp. HE19RPO]